MCPTLLAPPPANEELLERNVEPEPAEPPRSRPSISESPKPSPSIAPAAHKELFAEALLEMSSTRPPNRVVDFFGAMLLHVLIMGVLILIPLYSMDGIDLRQFYQTMLVAPPPPPPPPPAAAPVARTVAPVKRVFVSGGKLLAPISFPQRVAMLQEPDIPPDAGAIGMAGGVPGGVPGGSLGGVLGGIISNSSRTVIPPPAPAGAVKKQVYRVGGRVQQPQLLVAPQPVYPTIARRTRIEGVVQIEAIIDPEGNIAEMRVVSGNPLLISAALDALKQWKYRPTYLNDVAVSVQLSVILRFQMSDAPQ
jgi:protein TonB